MHFICREISDEMGYFSKTKMGERNSYNKTLTQVMTRLEIFFFINRTFLIYKYKD